MGRAFVFRSAAVGGAAAGILAAALNAGAATTVATGDAATATPNQAQLAKVGISPGRPGGADAATRTFSFMAAPRSKTVTLLNTNTLLINARCDANGAPVIFAFTSSSAADLFGHRVDSRGRLSPMNTSSFTNKGKGVELSSSRAGDFNTSGMVAFENVQGKVVTVQYAYDNSRTLVRRRLCTVYGSFNAS